MHMNDSRLTEEQLYQLLQHLDDRVNPLPYINALAERLHSELVLVVFGMMNVKGKCSELSDKAEPDYRDVGLGHRPHGAIGNIPLFDLENCTDEVFVTQVIDMLSDWLKIEPEYMDANTKSVLNSSAT